MPSDINYNLISAVHNGNLSEVSRLLDSYDLSYSPAWSEGYVLLRDAIKNKHTEISKLLLTNNGCRVNNKTNVCTDTPLHFAAINGDLEIVEMLLDRGAKVDAKNKCDETPLHYAVKSNKVEINIIKLLLNGGAWVNAKTIRNNTPLHFVVENIWIRNAPLERNGSDKIISLLLSEGAHIDATGPERFTALHLAVEKCSEKTIKFLLNSGANVDAKGWDGATPVHIAAQKGYFQIIEELLKYGADINSTYTSRSLKDYTPLHLAAKNGDKKITDLLLSNGAFVNAEGKDGVTPLHLAVRSGHKQIVEVLLENGANVDAQDKDGKTILHLAVERGHRVIIECVLKHSPDLNNTSNREALNVAVYGFKTHDVITKLLQYGFTVNPEDVKNPKIWEAAVGKGYFEIVKKLLEYGANVNLCTPLHAATINKLEEMAELLISFGADVNAQDEYGRTPIFYAIKNADLKIFNLLLINKADVRDNPELLVSAVEGECKEIVEILLQNDVDVKAKDKQKMTALLLIFFNNMVQFHYKDENCNVKLEIMRLLLSRGADANARTITGRTMIEVATLTGFAKVVEALLEHNADVDSIDANGGTLLHIAADIGHFDVVEILLKFDATVDSKDRSGRTPLHIASKRRNKSIIIALLQHGSDINIRSKSGQTALGFAREDDILHVINMERERLDQDYNYRRESYISPFEILEFHVIKLKIANLSSSLFDKNLNKYFQNKCEEEMAVLQNENIGDSNTSFYDILQKSSNQLIILLNNENILKILRSEEYKMKFPIYASMINCHFRIAEKRKKLLGQVNENCYIIFPDLPWECIQKVISYLSNKDLKILIESFKASNPDS